MNPPAIIRLEVEHMKHAIQIAITEYAAKMDADIQRAIERVCSPDHVREVIEQCVSDALADAVREESKTFFKYGEGRKIIRDAVEKKLLQHGPM